MELMISNGKNMVNLGEDILIRTRLFFKELDNLTLCPRLKIMIKSMLWVQKYQKKMSFESKKKP